MSIVAHQAEDLDIEARIAHLQKAVASAEKAVASPLPFPSAPVPSSGGRGLVVSDLGVDVRQLLSDNLTELKDTLAIAGTFATIDW